MQLRTKGLERVISCVGDLPALPGIVSEVLNITEDPSVAMSEIGQHVQRDPALTAKILKVSNSSYYGMRQYVGTLNLALVVLGVREVRNIVLGISVFDSLRDDKMDSAIMQEFWDHSVQVGGLSRRLGNRLALGLQGEDFIAGLLHDVGKIVLLRQMGPIYAKVFKESGGHSAPLCALEMGKLGFDHADVAAALAVYWNLPQTLADALWCHHSNPDRRLAEARDPKLAAVVRIANLAIRESANDVLPDPRPSCIDEEAWALLAASENVPASVEERAAMLAGIRAAAGDRAL